MEALSKLHICPRPLRLVSHNRPVLMASNSSISLKAPALKLASFPKSLPVCSIKASAALPPSSSSVDRNLSNHMYEAGKLHLTYFLKSTCVAVAAAALMMARFGYGSFPAIAAPLSALEMDKDFTSGVSDEEKEKERNLEKYLSSHPDDVEALQSLMDSKMKNHKLEEAVDVADRLMQIEPEEMEWPLLKAHMHHTREEHDTARALYEGVLLKDPLCVEAYSGLVMTLSQSGSGDELKKVEQRIEQAMEVFKKERKKDGLRDLKLLIAQIKVTEGDYNGALKLYEELVKEEPRDFRPYLCQGMIYALLEKNDEAEKQFEKYKRLVPRDHPYVQHFDDKMVASQVFLQKVARETAFSKS